MLFQRTLSVEENTKHWPQRLSDESTLQPPHPFKLKSGHCIAPFRENSPLKRSEWHMLTRDHSVLPATHTFIHEWNEPSCLHLPAAAHHRTLAGTYFPSHKAYDAELACVASYIPRWYVRHKTVTHSSTNRPIVRRRGSNSRPLSRKSDALDQQATFLIPLTSSSERNVHLRMIASSQTVSGVNNQLQIYIAKDANKEYLYFTTYINKSRREPRSPSTLSSDEKVSRNRLHYSSVVSVIEIVAISTLWRVTSNAWECRSTLNNVTY